MPLARLLLAALILLVLQSLFWSEVPFTFGVLVFALVGLTLVRPSAGLLVVAGLAPLGQIIAAALSVPHLRVAEAIVLAFLAGWALSLRSRARASTDAMADLAAPALLFAIAVVASCLVELKATQVRTDDPWPFVRGLATLVTRDYFVGPRYTDVVVTATLLLEGIGLLWAVVALAARESALPARLGRVVGVGGLGIAALSLVSLLMIGLRTSGPVAQALSPPPAAGRISVHVPDLNAAGSYFAMVLPFTVGLAWARTRWRALWWMASVALLAALWLTGSRAAVVAAFGGVLLFVAAIGSTWRHLLSWRAGIVAVLAAAVIVAVAIRYYPQPLVSSDAMSALTIRREFVGTSLRMLETRPVFGVGVGRYYPLSGAFSSPALRAIYPRENAHNNFLQIAAEMGFVGVALFLWVLASALRRAWRGLRRDPIDPPLAGLVTGLTAFLLTCLAGHPLLVREVAYPFWMALGLAATQAGTRPAALSESGVESGQATKRASTRAAPALDRRRWHPPAAVVVASLVLVGSIPWRVKQEVGQINLSGVSYGFWEWELDETGKRFRWTSGRSTLFVSARADIVEIPVRSVARPSNLAPMEVEILVDGRAATRVRPETMWRRIRVRLPPPESQARFRRIDLIAAYTWIPAQVFPGSSDPRGLGVQVGEVTVVSRQRD